MVKLERSRYGGQLGTVALFVFEEQVLLRSVRLDAGGEEEIDGGCAVALHDALLDPAYDVGASDCIPVR